MSLIPEERLRELCGKLEGRYALYVSVPAEGESFSIHGSEQFSASSTIKIPVLALLLQDGEQGRLDLNKPVRMSPENRVGGSGILLSLSEDLEMSLFDYAVMMMAISDNSATNEVMDAVGVERAAAFAAEHGWSGTHIVRKMMKPGPLLPDGTMDRNYVTAADLGDLLEKVSAGTLVSRRVSDDMLRIMACQRNGRFRPALPDRVSFLKPRGPLTAPEPGKVFLAAKGGTWMGDKDGTIAHDAGVLWFGNGRRAVLVMLTKTPDMAVTEEIMRRVARTVYDALC